MTPGEYLDRLADEVAELERLASPPNWRRLTGRRGDLRDRLKKVAMMVEGLRRLLAAGPTPRHGKTEGSARAIARELRAGATAEVAAREDLRGLAAIYVEVVGQREALPAAEETASAVRVTRASGAVAVWLTDTDEAARALLARAREIARPETPENVIREAIDWLFSYAELYDISLGMPSARIEHVGHRDDALAALERLTREFQPGYRWRVIAPDGSLWCETRGEEEARERMRPDDRLERLYIAQAEEWRVE